jgi:hypothetical protein
MTNAAEQVHSYSYGSAAVSQLTVSAVDRKISSSAPDLRPRTNIPSASPARWQPTGSRIGSPATEPKNGIRIREAHQWHTSQCYSSDFLRVIERGADRGSVDTRKAPPPRNTDGMLKMGIEHRSTSTVALELHRRGAATALVASDRNLCEVAAVEGLEVVNPIQSP